MYKIKISLPHKTINHSCLTLPKAYAIIMSSYRHLKQSNEDIFSILLYDCNGKLLRVTNKYVYGVKSKQYIHNKMISC